MLTKIIYLQNRTILHLGGKNKTKPQRNAGKEQSSKVACGTQLQGWESRGCTFFLIRSRCAALIHGRHSHSQTLVYDIKWQKAVPLTAATPRWVDKALAVLAAAWPCDQSGFLTWSARWDSSSVGSRSGSY